MSRTKSQVLELLNPIVIAKVMTFRKHEDADKLFVVDIDPGNADISADIKDEKEYVQIVTGADNFKVGDLVPYLSPGHLVPGWLFKEGQEIRLESRKMRGIMSHGMILAEDEVGLGDDHSGIIVIDSTNPKFQLPFPIKSGTKSDVISDEFRDLIGQPLSTILSEESLQSIFNLAGVVEITSEMQEKIDLITRDLEETIGIEDLPAVLKDRNMKVYWGTAPTGKPSVGYFVPMIKIADFLKADCEVKILFANIHAFLDNMKSSWELLEFRTQYYQLVIKEILKSLGAPLEKLTFVNGTDYQLDPKYTMDMYKIATLTTIQSVKGAGAEVVKQVESPILGGLLYPILQALDEQYLDVDAQLGGMDQRKIFMFAREYLPKVGYKKRFHLMNTLIPGLGKSGKMSSSEPNSKIDLDETDESVNEKINKAFSLDGEVEGNGLLALLKFVIFRKLEIEGRSIKIERPEKWGGNAEYSNYADLEKDFIEKKLSSVDLKPAVAKEVIELIKPIREAIQANSDLMYKAYPKGNH